MTVMPSPKASTTFSHLDRQTDCQTESMLGKVRLLFQVEGPQVAAALTAPRRQPKVQAVRPNLTFLDPQLEAAYLREFNAKQVPQDAAILILAAGVHLLLAAGLSRKSDGTAQMLSALVMMAFDVAAVWLIHRRTECYIRHREALLGWWIPLHVLQAQTYVRHGMVAYNCSSQLAFWLTHLVSSALVYIVAIPLVLPVRYCKLCASQAACLALVLAPNSLRCDVTLAVCAQAPDWYAQTAALLHLLCSMVPFPVIVESLDGKAACIGVYQAVQICVAYIVLAYPAYHLEHQRRAAFAREAGLKEVYALLMRRKRRSWGVVSDAVLVFVVVWTAQCLFLPKLFPI